MTYDEYINSDEWKRKREWFLIFWNRRCCLCNSTEKLNVHHRTYERLGDELLTDCVVLCDPCHVRNSQVFKYDDKMRAFWQWTLSEINEVINERDALVSSI